MLYQKPRRESIILVRENGKRTLLEFWDKNISIERSQTWHDSFFKKNLLYINKSRILKSNLAKHQFFQKISSTQLFKPNIERERECYWDPSIEVADAALLHLTQGTTTLITTIQTFWEEPCWHEVASPPNENAHPSMMCTHNKKHIWCTKVHEDSKLFALNIAEFYTATYLVTFHFTKHFSSLIVNISRNCQKNQHVLQESGMGNVRDLRWLHINCTMNFTNFQTLKADHKGMPTSTKVSNPKTGPLEIFAGADLVNSSITISKTCSQVPVLLAFSD